MAKITTIQKTAMMMRKSHPIGNPHPHIQGCMSWGESVPLKRLIVPGISRLLVGPEEATFDRDHLANGRKRISPVEERIVTTSRDTRKDNTNNKDRGSGKTLPKGKSACSEGEDKDIPIRQGA